jgi:competence protein ComEC
VGHDILARYLRHERIRRIDLMVLTHPHDDHIWGLNALLDPRERFDVRTVLDTGQTADTPAYREWMELLRQQKVERHRARRGTRVEIGSARLEVLHPPEPLQSGTRSDLNNNSIVLRLEIEGSRVLLAGDAEEAAETSMAGLDLGADVLKVGHHGSATSTGEAWLRRVKPEIAVISCGVRNPFGHPSRVVVERLERQRVEVYRTDHHGAVTLELGREGWDVRTTLGEYGAAAEQRAVNDPPVPGKGS